MTATAIGRLSNVGKDSESKQLLLEKRQAEAALRRTHNELLWRIRSELEFGERALPGLHVREHGLFPGMMRVDFQDEAIDDEIPTYDFFYIQCMKKDDLDWVFGMRFPIGDTPLDDDKEPAPSTDDQPSAW